jgi:hypothetical protein
VTARALAALLAALGMTAIGATTHGDEGCPAPSGDGGRVQRKGLGEAGKPVRIGLVADARDASSATLANLERFAGVFHREHVAAVIALGGLGATEEEIARVLTALKPSQAPVLALAGGREPEAAFHAGVQRAKKAGLDVVDLVQNRAAAGDGLAVVALPGDPLPRYVAASGCRARAGELEPFARWATGLSKPTLLVAHTPPRGGGPSGIGWAPAGADDGDAELTKVLPSLGAKVGAFAAAPDVEGRAWDGQAPVAEGAWAEQLWVAVGAAGAMSRHHGQAMMLEIADGKARAKVIR